MTPVIPLPTKCPDCGATLSQEEKELDECWSCGWPYGDTPMAEIHNMPPGFAPDKESDTNQKNAE